jgi:Avidin family
MLHENALARAVAGTGASYGFAGTWKNELGSQVVLTQTNDKLAGTYKSAVSGGGTSTTGDLQGYVDGDLIAFIVHWRSFQAITAWVGQVVPKAEPAQILTLWQMTQQVAVGDEWQSINAGTDRFTRV